MSYSEDIEELRSEINKLNKDIIEKIKKRVEIAQKIGEVKKKHGKPIKDKARESIVYQQVKRLSEKNCLPSDNIESIFKEIINICIKAEEEPK
jgi:3-deoxy-7-phosphoheptulonate synthase/chorismate mutase